MEGYGGVMGRVLRDGPIYERLRRELSGCDDRVVMGFDVVGAYPLT